MIVAVALGGCRRRSDEASPEGAQAERIVSFAPSLTEIAVELGLGDALVGVSTFDTHAQAAGLERVGGMADPNLELLVALEPDLVLATPSVARVEAFVEDHMAQTRVVSHEINTLDELVEAYVVVGEAAGVGDLGARRAAALREALDALTVEVPEGTARPQVLLVVWRDPGALSGLTAAGPGTFLDELLERAGGRNVLPESVGPWPVLGKEALYAHPPDLVIELTVDAKPGDDALEVWRQTMPELAAVRDARIHRLSGAHLLLPGPRVVETLRDLRVMISGDE